MIIALFVVAYLAFSIHNAIWLYYLHHRFPESVLVMFLTTDSFKYDFSHTALIANAIFGIVYLPFLALVAGTYYVFSKIFARLSFLPRRIEAKAKLNKYLAEQKLADLPRLNEGKSNYRTNSLNKQSKLLRRVKI